jgi:hypothetical protein
MDASPDWVITKTMKLVFATFLLKIFTTIPLSTQLLRNKTKGWLARNQDNVSEWSEMTFH